MEDALHKRLNAIWGKVKDALKDARDARKNYEDALEHLEDASGV